MGDAECSYLFFANSQLISREQMHTFVAALIHFLKSKKNCVIWKNVTGGKSLDFKLFSFFKLRFKFSFCHMDSWFGYLVSSFMALL